MKTKIYCTVSSKGTHSFFLEQDGKRYFLFNQYYRKSVHKYFQYGVSLEAAISFDKIHGDGALSNTMDKLPAYIKYIEKEYQIAVLEKTREKQKKCSSYKRAKALSRMRDYSDFNFSWDTPTYAY